METPEFARMGDWPGWLYKAEKLMEQGKPAKGLSVIYNELDDLLRASKFVYVNNLLSLEPKYLSVRSILAFLVLTALCAADLLPNRERFRREAEGYLRTTTEWEERLLENL